MRREPGLEARFLIPDLQAIIKVQGSQSAAARRIGMSEGWLRGILTGRRTHVSYATAQKVGAAVRGDRALDEEWRKEERAKDIRASKRIAERKARQRYPGRHEVTHSDHVCIHCGGKCDSEHALYMHSRAKHGDTSQGKNRWSRLKS